MKVVDLLRLGVKVLLVMRIFIGFCVEGVWVIWCFLIGGVEVLLVKGNLGLCVFCGFSGCGGKLGCLGFC